MFLSLHWFTVRFHMRQGLCRNKNCSVQVEILLSLLYNNGRLTRGHKTGCLHIKTRQSDILFLFFVLLLFLFLGGFIVLAGGHSRLVRLINDPTDVSRCLVIRSQCRGLGLRRAVGSITRCSAQSFLLFLVTFHVATVS